MIMNIPNECKLSIIIIEFFMYAVEIYILISNQYEK